MHAAKTPLWLNALAHLFPLSIAVFFIFTTFTDPQQMHLYISKDHIEGGGLIENLTVLVLIPGIIAGAYTFFKYRKSFSTWLIPYWLLMWTLACFYFAGEEISWGQWLFEWETPQSISQLNDQNETNFHNMSTWLDQKPRTLVELWIFLTGLILPIFRSFKNNDEKFWKQWIFPVNSLFTAALLFTAVRLSGWIENPVFRDLLGSSEFRELTIAVFLSLYLISFWARAIHNNHLQ